VIIDRGHHGLLLEDFADGELDLAHLRASAMVRW
jgi:hypothetical protein